MVARVIQGVVKEGNMDEVLRLLKESLGPKVRQMPGFKSLLLLTNAGSGHTMSISLWESGESLEEGQTSGFLDEQLAEVIPLLEEAPSSRTFRVSTVVEPD